jgi:hypothetical protein
MFINHIENGFKIVIRVVMEKAGPVVGQLFDYRDVFYFS